MKKLLYPIGFLLIILVSVMLMGPLDSDGNEPIVIDLPQDPEKPTDLQSYASHIAGHWETPPMEKEEEQVGFSLLVDPRLIHDGHLKIVESEYCRPGMAEYLHFVLRGEKLTYTGASLDGCFFDLDRIHFIDIWYEITEGDTVLHYEASEMEYENYVRHLLYRKPMPEEDDKLWRCALQGHLLELLREGDYNLYDAEGEARDHQILFADESMFGGVYFYDAYTAFWPDYEEICYQAPFDIVVLGGLDKVIYAIDWQTDQITLYNTHQETDDKTQTNWLKKGSLRYVIIPDDPQPKPEIDTELFK